MERLVQMPFDNGHLAGVLTVPAIENGHTVLIPWGSGAYPSSGRNRLRAELARHLAGLGFHALRFDWPGVGESTGAYDKGDLNRPFTSQICAATDWLLNQAPGHLLVVANCFGGWSAMKAASSLPDLEGLAVINPPISRDHSAAPIDRMASQPWATAMRRISIAKLRDPRLRARYRKALVVKMTRAFGKIPGDSRSSGFLAALEELLDRKTQVLMLYGNDDFRGDFERLMSQGLEERLRREPNVKVVRVENRMQGCTALPAQAVIFDEVVPWLQHLASHQPSSSSC